MTQISVVAIAVLLCATVFEVHAISIHKLSVTQDVTLERGSRNYNYLRYLIVAKHPNYPLKRSLLQFRNPPASCTRIIWAKMYVYFAYAHKASFHSPSYTPYIPRPLQVYQVKKRWSETQATSLYRLRGVRWSRPWLSLDGRDANPRGLLPRPVIINKYSRPGFKVFDITPAMRNWKKGQPNYGVLLRATNEYSRGRDIRFYSNAERNRRRHAFVIVLCY